MAKAKKEESNLTQAVEYWTGTTYVPGVGTVSGMANPQHVKIFDAYTANVKGLKRENYLTTINKPL